MTKLFLSYARGDDEPFVEKLYHDLTARGFDVWFDRKSMPSRNLTFHQEIRDAVADCDRLVLVVGRAAVASDYVRQEWQFAWIDADSEIEQEPRSDKRTQPCPPPGKPFACFTPVHPLRIDRHD